MHLRTGSALLAGLVLACAACERKPEPPPAGTTTTTAQSRMVVEYEVHPSILIEAESGQVAAPMQVQEDSQASGGRCVTAPEGPNHKEISVGGDATYRLSVSEPGQYALWLRVRWCCSCGNSFDVALDGAAAGTVEDSVFGEWRWVGLLERPLTLAAGEHLLVISNREDGAALDQILLTRDADYRPAEIERPDAKGRIFVGPAEPAQPPTPDR